VKCPLKIKPVLSLVGITVQTKIYESAKSVVYRGVRESDHTPVILKVLNKNYPSPQELIRYRQEFKATHALTAEGVIKADRQYEYQRTVQIDSLETQNWFQFVLQNFTWAICATAHIQLHPLQISCLRDFIADTLPCDRDWLYRENLLQG